MTNCVRAFAYGALANEEIAEAIAGSPLKQIGRDAILFGYGLTVQTWQQVPGNLQDPDSPQAIVKNVWGEDFKSYGLAEKPAGSVRGKIWQMTPEQRMRFRSWEFCDKNRGDPHQWFTNTTVQVRTVEHDDPGGARILECETEVLENQDFAWAPDDIADLEEPPLFIPAAKVVEHAHRVFAT